MKKCLTLCLCLTALLCLIFITTPKAQAATYGNLTYEVNGGEATITDCNTSATGALAIPATINGYPVTTIGYEAFEDCTSLTGITIPDSVTTIGRYAFSNCTSLSGVTIPDSVTTIGAWAFYSCDSLTSVTIPDSVTTIGNSAFRDCTSLTSITIPDSVTTIGDYAFYNCTGLTDVYITDPNAWCKISFGVSYANPLSYADNGHILDADGKELTELVLGTSVTSIPDYAFRKCNRLTSVTIPDSVTTIGDDAFYNCRSLTSITIPASVTTIGEGAFYNCTSLTSITIPDSVTTIGNYAFHNCTSLTKLQVDEKNPAYSSDAYGVLFNKNKTKLIAASGVIKSYTIPDSVTTIGTSAFEDCTGLTGITIPDSVTTIGSDAFSGCDSLTSVTIPDSVTTIGSYAFRGCTILQGIWVDEKNPNYSSDSKGVLFNKNKTTLIQAPGRITSYSIPDSVTTIGNYAFYNCTGLTGITIPDSVTTIGSSAFSGCSNLKSMTIPFVGDSRKTATDTYQYPFGYIFGTSSYTGGISTIQYYYGSSASYTTSNTYYIPASLKSVTVTGGNILYGAFRNCTSLTSVTIGDSVTTIGDSAFASCDSLTSVTIGDSVTTIGERAFSWCDSLTSVTIGDSVTTIGTSAFRNCTSLTSITIPDSVTTIGSSAFCYCYSLTSVTIPDSVTTIGTSAFYYCRSLTSVTIPDSVTTISTSAFEDCTGLTSVTIPDSVTTVGNYAFRNCTSLTGITIPDSVTTIGNYAFYNCTSLTSITIPDSVTTIGTSAFEDCTGLTSVTIPDSVTTIGSDAFWGCSKLKNVYYSGTEAQWKNISIGSYNSPLNNATKHYSHIHDYTLFPAETVAPTCTTVGYTIYTCAYGETMQADFVPALGHAPGTLVNQVVPTCTAGGHTDYLCSRCGVQYRTETVASLGHDYTGPEKTVEPTCTASGRIGASCTRCDAVREDTVLDALGHQVVLVPVCDPTCTEKGVSKAGTQCERCKTYFVEPVWIPALGHSFTDYIPNNDATYFADGTKTATCTTCGEKDTVVDEGTRLIPEGNGILLQPENVNADSGATVSFSVEAFGEIVSYQWQYRKVYKWFDTTLSGYNTDTLTLAATGARNGYDYRCVITFADGTVLISEPAELTVNTTITVTKSPNNQTAVLGDKGQFTASAEGEGIKYQWQYCRPGSEKWIDTAMEGATKATVYIETTKSRDNYQYRCKITDVTGKVVYTEAATLRVMSITEHPADRFTAPGKTVTFSVITNVTGGVTYQWQYRKSETANWTNTTMTGYNTATLSVAATLARNGYQYRCIITGSKNSKLESKPATLHAGNPVQFTAQPQDLTVIDSENAVLTVSATNAYAYCWQYRSDGNSWRNTSLTGYNTDTLTVPAIGKNGYQYRCVITGLDGETYTSEAATLTVVEAPRLEIMANPNDRTVPAERDVKFAVLIDGEVTAYRWQYTLDGQSWLDAQGEGTDTNILTVIATPDLSGTQFRCVITGQYGMQVITQSATLTVQ